MTVIAPAPIVLSNMTLQLGTNNFETSISTASLVPTTPTTTWKGVGGNVIQVAGTPVWVLNIAGLQDPKTATSLQNYLNANAGLNVVGKLAPQAGTGNTLYTFNVTLVPVQIGGDADALAAFTQAFNVTGQPVPSALP